MQNKGTKITLLSEEEKIITLDQLKSARSNILSLLEKLPVGFRTLATEKKRNYYFNKLTEVEDAIYCCNNPQVKITVKKLTEFNDANV